MADLLETTELPQPALDGFPLPAKLTVTEIRGGSLPVTERIACQTEPGANLFLSTISAILLKVRYYTFISRHIRTTRDVRSA